MGKETAFDRVELRAVAWVVGHSDFDSQFVDEVLQVLFEKILCRRIASATVAQQEDGLGVRVASLADTVPVPAEAVACELARVVAQADVDMAAIAKEVVDAVRNNDAGSPTGKVMVERPEWPAASTRGPRERVARDVLLPWYRGKTRGCPPQSTWPSVRRSAGTGYPDQGCVRLPEPSRSCVAPAFASFIQSCTTGGLTGVPMSVTASANLPRREVRPQHVLLVGIARRCGPPEPTFRFCSSSGSDSIFFFDPPPGRRTRPAAGSCGSLSKSASPRSIVRCEHPNTLATYSIPPCPSRRASTATYRRRSFSDNVCIKGPNLFHHFRFVLRLKYEGHPWLHSIRP